MKRILTEVSKNVKVSVYFFDEWDANLDRENKAMFNEMLKDLSKKACVIESRHYI